jgi:succinoglycan biosynthesis transport protein ExoP
MADQIQRVVQGMAAPAPVHPAMMRMAPPAVAAVSLTPKEIVGILRRHLLMILLFTLTGLVAGIGGYFVMRLYFPKYTAITGITVLPPGTDPPRGFNAGQPQKDLYYQFRFTKASLMKQQDMMQMLIAQDTIRETTWFGRFQKRNAAGEVIKTNIPKAIDDLDKKLGASAPRDQDFIRVSMTCGDPKEAARIVNEMVRLFMNDQREKARSGIAEQMTSEERLRQDLRTTLKSIQDRLDGLRTGSEFGRLNIEGANFRDYMDQKLGTLYDEYSRLEAERNRLQVILATVERRATSADYDQVIQQAVEQDQNVRQLQNSINNIEALLAQQLARFGENHRRVIETRQTRDQFKKDLDARKIEIAEIERKSQWQSVQDEMAALTQELESVTQQVQRARDEYKRVDNDRSEYAKYEIEREEKQAQLEKSNEYYESLKALYDDPELSKLRSLGLAQEPLERSSPQWKIYLPAGFILGLLAGLGLAFAVELLNDLVRTPADVMRHLKVPLLGSICHADDDDEIEGVDLSHVVRQAPYSIMSECYRQLRTNLKLSAGAATHKALLITSPDAGDGKTTIATNLTSTLLAENKKVVLLDANFRRPATGQLFPRTGETGALIEHADFGLSNYLMGQCTDAMQIIRPSGIPGLDIIDSGPLPSSPAELLDSQRMKELLDLCKAKYDHVILDGPPMLVSDAKSLASAADGTIVVFNAAITHRGAAMRILRELQSIHANTIGTVLMGVKSRKGGYFQEVYRSYLEYQRVPVNPNL